ncbi:MAG: DedA family protein, partial [Desulfosarcinaceae bacterium]
MTDFLNSILPQLAHFRMGIYWIGFIAAFLETVVGIGFILPGSTVVLFLGALSARGYLDVGDLVWFCILGAVIGDNLNYFLGKKYGAKWTGDGFWLVKPGHLEKAKQFMEAHGAKSVFLGRFIPSIKEIVPFIAGSVNMDRKKFMLWNVLGAVGWGCQWVFAGYLFAQSLNLAELWLTRAGLFFALIFIFGLFFYFVKWLIVRRGKQFFEVAASLWRSVREALQANDHVRAWADK